MTTSNWLTGLASATLAVAALTVAPAPAAAADGDPAVMIIGGSDATEAYPFAVRLLTNYPELGGVVQCTATLVTYRGVTAVVTSAHCVSDLTTGAAKPAADIQVQVGSTRSDTLSTITPDGVLVHPDWDWGTGDNQFADIAVLTLKTDLPLIGIRIGAHAGEHRPVRLLGWGKTAVDTPEPAAVLQQLDTRLTAASDCAAARITTGEICVHGAAGATACQGDAGGPALGQLRQLSGRWVLLGAASRGVDSTCSGPTVYTDITHFRAWIGQVVVGDVTSQRRHVEAGAAARFLAHRMS